MPYKDVKKTNKGWVLVHPDGSFMRIKGKIRYFKSEEAAHNAMRAILAKE